MKQMDTTRNEAADGGPVDPELDALGDRMQSLARAESRLEAPPHVEAALLRTWDAAHPQRERRRIPWAPWAAAAAAALVVTAVTMSRGALAPDPAPRSSTASDVRLALESPPIAVDAAPAGRAPRRVPRRRPEVVLPRQRPDATTVVLVGTPVMAGERIRVVRMRVARQTLMAMGLRPIAQDDSASVDVEMLVGEDGVARGLRVRM